MTDTIERSALMEIRRNAATLLREHGWDPSALRSGPRFSMFGAIAQAAAGDVDTLSSEETQILVDLRQQLGVENLWAWHEASERQRLDIVWALEGTLPASDRQMLNYE